MRSKRGLSPAVWALGGSLVAAACSLTAPSKDELFRSGSGGKSDGGNAGSSASGGTTPGAGSGGKETRAGSSGVGGAGEGGAGGSVDAGTGGTGGTGNTGNTSTGGVAPSAGEGGRPSAGEGGTDASTSGAGGEGGWVPDIPFEPTEGLVAHYPFDEATGTIAEDGVGDLDGTINGTITRVSGKIDGAVRLSGSMAYVDVPVTPLATLEEVTFALWFNPGTQTLWTRVLDVGSSQSHWMYFSPAAAPTGQGTGTHVALDVSNQIAAELHDASFVPPIQTWTHIAITWKREYFAYYINGKLALADDTPLFTPAEFVSYTPAGETLRAWLGRSSFSVDAYFTGAIDDFRIYDRALSRDHVKDLYVLAE